MNWERRNNKADENETFKITVDGTHCPIEEIYNEDGTLKEGYYSHKFHKAGLSYEVAVAIFSDNIVWVKGPFRAGMSDQKIFKEQGLAKLLIACKEKAVADGGYTHWAVSQRGNGPHEWKHAKNRYRARQESVNSRLKIFKCLEHRWRHDHEYHGQCFRAVTMLTQISFAHNPLMEPIVD